ncbi:outer membrane protein transport protein [bacterium]|nr:outer membrane protein transport protein [candidate division CSSED10-310 bacterium]
MRSVCIPVFLCIILIIVANFSVHGAGFSVYEQGATATGMAGAFAAKADDATAVFYNPAGISQLEGTHLSVGLTWIPPETEMTDPYGGTWETESQDFLVPNLYLTHGFNDTVAIGLGIYAPFGLGMDWTKDDDWIYRYLVKDVSVESMYVNPVISFSLNENWSVAAGAIWVASDVEYVAAVDMTPVEIALSEAMGMDFTLPDSELRLEGDNENGDWGYSLAIHGTINRFHLGLAYRSAVECGYIGDATFDVPASGYGSTVDGLINGFFPDTQGTTSIEMPASIQLGLGYDVTDAFYVEFDVLWHGWSSYKSLDIDFEEPSLTDVQQTKDWDDVMSYRLGLYYQMTDQAAIFGGYYFDETPIPDRTLDPILPGADRNSFQVGASYDFGGLKLEGSYMALLFDDRETTTNYRDVNGKYESSTHIFSAQVSYSF